MVAIVRFLLLSCCVVVGLSTPATAEPSLPVNADALVEEGIAAYEAEDYQRAKNILLPLAEAGHGKAMNKIGRMYYDGHVFPRDPHTECDWYEKAANSNYPSGMYNLSICYSEGRGRPKNPSQLLFWRKKAALLGSKSAMINLSALDMEKGEKYLYWMNMAQKRGSAFAKVDLWINGHRELSQMTFSNFICVTWNILYGEQNFEYCD